MGRQPRAVTFLGYRPRDEQCRCARTDAVREASKTVYVLAVEGTGLDTLLERIDRLIDEDQVSRVQLLVPQKEGKTLDMLKARTRIYSRKHKDRAVEIDADAPESVVRRVKGWVVT